MAGNEIYTADHIEHIKKCTRELFIVSDELQQSFRDRSFALDGHLILNSIVNAWMNRPFCGSALPLSLGVGYGLALLFRLCIAIKNARPFGAFPLSFSMIGSIGEVIAAYYYDLKLLKSSSAKHGAMARDGRLVQIKVTRKGPRAHAQ